MVRNKTRSDARNVDAVEGLSPRRRRVRYSLALVLGCMLALGWVACLSYDPGDVPGTQVWPRAWPTHNLAGRVGAIFSHVLFTWLGSGTYMGLLLGSLAVLLVILGGQIRDAMLRVIGVTLLIAGTSTGVYLVQAYSVHGHLLGGGGVLGTACGIFLRDHFGGFSWMIVLVTTLVGLILAADELVLRLPHLGRRLWGRRKHLAKMTLALRAAAAQKHVAASAVTTNPRPAAAGHLGADKAKGRVSIAQDPPESGSDEPPDVEPKAKVSSALKDKIKSLVANTATVRAPDPPRRPSPTAPSAPAKDDGPYVLPNVDLLAEAEQGYLASQEVQVELKRAVLQQTLDDFNVEAKVVGHMTGPVITMFELSLSPGVKVSQIANLGNDIARSLAAPGVRIVSPIPGKDTIGIEVPNAQKETVRLRQLIELADSDAGKYRLPLYLGKDAGGSPIVADLATMPHMLIAGTTGSGKSVCINTIIMSMLMTRRPEDVRLILVDPKMVEMATFERLPHLLCPIVNDMRKAESILEWAAVKMDERYDLFKDAGVKNIDGYNALGAEKLYKRLGVETDEEKAHILTRIPFYVIIIDELADLIMTSSKEVEGHIIRLAQKARAVGIHLILSTQRPSVNVVTGLIKSNMPCRISFRVASRQESRIVLDQNGAEVLLGRGDMLFLQPGTSNLIRAQGTFADDSEIRGVVDHLTAVSQPTFNQELSAIKPAGMEDDDVGERDELFDKAVEIILQCQRGSVSLLQRRLAIGYSRASRVVDQMAEAGILGDYKGSQARECLMTLEEWQTLRAGIEADQSGASALDGQPTSV